VEELARDMKFSQRRELKSISSKLWRCLLLCYDTRLSEKHTDSVSRVIVHLWTLD